MPIREASQAEILAMKERLNRRQGDRLAEKQMDEVVQMVGKKRRPFAKAPRRGRQERAQWETAGLAVGSCLLVSAAALLGNMEAITMGQAMGVMMVAAMGGTISAANWMERSEKG